MKAGRVNQALEAPDRPRIELGALRTTTAPTRECRSVSVRRRQAISWADRGGRGLRRTAPELRLRAGDRPRGRGRGGAGRVVRRSSAALERARPTAEEQPPTVSLLLIASIGTSSNPPGPRPRMARGSGPQASGRRARAHRRRGDRLGGRDRRSGRRSSSYRGCPRVGQHGVPRDRVIPAGSRSICGGDLGRPAGWISAPGDARGRTLLAVAVSLKSITTACWKTSPHGVASGASQAPVRSHGRGGPQRARRRASTATVPRLSA